jgi:hypothetical protein
MNAPRPSDIRVEAEKRSKVQALTSLLAEYKIGVYLTIISLTVLLATGRWQIPSLAPWQKQTLTVFAVGIIPSIIGGKKLVVEKYLPDDRYVILEIDPDNFLAMRAQKVGRRLWKTRETGDYPAFEPPKGEIDYVVTDMDYHRQGDDGEGAYLDVEGCNEEVANPLDIIATQGRLDQVYHDLLERDQQLTRTQATIEAKTLEIDRENVMSLLEAVEHGARFGGSALDVITDDHLDGVDADDDDEPEVEDAEQDDRPTLSQVVGEDLDPRLAKDGSRANGDGSGGDDA